MQGKASNPVACATPFSVEIPSGTLIEVNISPYDGPNLSTDFRREVCTLKLPTGSPNAKVILRVYILNAERKKAEDGTLKLWKFRTNWVSIPSTYDPNLGYLQADIPLGDPPIAVG